MNVGQSTPFNSVSRANILATTYWWAIITIVEIFQGLYCLINVANTRKRVSFHYFQCDNKSLLFSLLVLAVY